MLGEFRKRSESSWKILDTHLSGRSHVVGDRLTIADISICGYLFFDEDLGVDWDQYPNIRDWLARLRAVARLETSVRPAARSPHSRQGRLRT